MGAVGNPEGAGFRRRGVPEPGQDRTEATGRERSRRLSRFPDPQHALSHRLHNGRPAELSVRSGAEGRRAHDISPPSRGETWPASFPRFSDIEVWEDTDDPVEVTRLLLEKKGLASAHLGYEGRCMSFPRRCWSACGGRCPTSSGRIWRASWSRAE